MSREFDEIRMRIPLKAEYVSLIRLSVSGIASKTGFDIDTIEDIKVAVSEVCNRVISMNNLPSEAHYDIMFHLFKDGFKAFFTLPCKPEGDLFEGESGEFAQAIISSLMDEFTVSYGEECVVIMGKNLGDCPNG